MNKNNKLLAIKTSDYSCNARANLYFCSMQTFKIEGEYIQLIQLLKALNWVEHGAMAQEVVSLGYVKYNGQVDHRKRLKLRPGDQVEYEGMEVKLV